MALELSEVIAILTGQHHGRGEIVAGGGAAVVVVALVATGTHFGCGTTPHQ